MGVSCFQSPSWFRTKLKSVVKSRVFMHTQHGKNIPVPLPFVPLPQQVPPLFLPLLPLPQQVPPPFVPFVPLPRQESLRVVPFALQLFVPLSLLASLLCLLHLSAFQQGQ